MKSVAATMEKRAKNRIFFMPHCTEDEWDTLWRYSRENMPQFLPTLSINAFHALYEMVEDSK